MFRHCVILPVPSVLRTLSSPSSPSLLLCMSIGSAPQSICPECDEHLVISARTAQYWCTPKSPEIPQKTPYAYANILSLCMYVCE